MSRQPPPPEIQTIVELIGEEAALVLIETHGGARIVIPANADGSNLARDIGYAAAAAISAYYGRGEMKIPLCKPWRACVLREQGLSWNEIARRLQMSYSAVERALDHYVRDGSAGLRPVSRQLNLL